MVYFILDTLLDTFLDTFFGQIFCALTLTSVPPMSFVQSQAATSSSDISTNALPRSPDAINLASGDEHAGAYLAS